MRLMRLSRTRSTTRRTQVRQTQTLTTRGRTNKSAASTCSQPHERPNLPQHSRLVSAGLQWRNGTEWLIVLALQIGQTVWINLKEVWYIGQVKRIVIDDSSKVNPCVLTALSSNLR